MPDPRAFKILLRAYWDSGGWKTERIKWPDGARNPVFVPDASKEDVAYARRAGVMFSPRTFGHASRITWARNAARLVTATEVASAFVASLSSKRVDLRSALSSFAVARHLPKHRYVQGQNVCAVCGSFRLRAEDDLSVMNFERCKFGGVRLDDPVYVGLDLRLLTQTERAKPTRDDVVCLSQILCAARSMKRTQGTGDLSDAMRGIFSATSYQRNSLIDVLQLAGVLWPRDRPSLASGFVRHADRHWGQWTGAIGVNSRAADHWFGRWI